MGVVSLIDSEGVVVNTVMLDDDADWTVPEGLVLIRAAANVGDTWDGEKFIAPVVEPSAPTQDDYKDAVQAHIDAAARSRNYADGVSLASYVASTVPGWAAEAQAFVAWRDAVWFYAYSELAKVLTGQRAQPSIAEFISELPAIVWPD
ncbi:hypothetical protein DLM45_02340 [Hyphomicrobium methylovorum]|uniref:hypothetical protein n=1 Tax=Hyphomicrobium methylovorum TaxID=84 RepID=UPI0015E7E072|nr:hypothetical protein [Hyphomicrobium methylovorum]MBA2125065.1 hypothetical protein [Hyphomicrobium methylovorum]